jgi:signal transduction histidine kinase
VTLIERPFRTVTITSLIQMALRARRRQYEVRGLLKELNAAVSQRDEFISIASHELKTPLTSLKLQTQLHERALNRGDTSLFSPDKLRKIVHGTNQQLDRLARLVEDMLDVSRINTGKLTVQKTQMDLTSLIGEIIERLSPQLDEAECVLNMDLEKNVVGTWDPYRIEQVIGNLLSNAIRYSARKPVHLSLRTQASQVEVKVRDEGPGIAFEDQMRVFERFERAVTSKHISGLGLGLYISKQIVESHQGQIQLESELGRGSTFTIRMPKNLN